MILSDAKQLIGEVTSLELVNGLTVTTKIKEVQTSVRTKSVLDGVEDSIEPCDPCFICDTPVEYRMMDIPPDPKSPPVGANSPVPQLVPTQYGYPIYDVRSLKIPIVNVMFALDPPKYMIDAYNEATTGIVIASAGSVRV